MPIGYLVTVTLIAVCTLSALIPPRRPRLLAVAGFRLGLAINELPAVAFVWLLASTLLAFAQGDIATAGGWSVFGLAVLTACGLAVIAWRGARTGAAVDRALDRGLGPGWRDAIDPRLAAGLRDGIPLGRALLAPFSVRRHDVEKTADIAYGPAGERNLLDLYRPRSGAPTGPTLIHLHGGGFTGGRKDHQALPLLYRLAGQGWVCVSANYRLRPEAGFPDHLVDYKKVIAWVREHGREYGADPSQIFAAGTSAGGHMAAMAGLTPGDPRFQPGFEHVDTSVSAVICLNAYYGPLDDGKEVPSSPEACIRRDAPPVFIAHGDSDTLVPVEDVRRFAERLALTSSAPTVYAELPGAQHAFDLFSSPRFETVVNAVEAFTAWVRSTQTETRGR
ncbi:alpha/beta hydrolase [Actinocorallia sp. B10E7]|uniref:alpha/beta hydrolase n=1 Tax=Actinocorallia sp. B10E7 TaxID=3153558 RepID=UPI00325DA5AF